MENEALWYDELFIKIELRNRPAFIAALEGSFGMQGRWRRMAESEIRIPSATERYFYLCEQMGDRPRTLLAICARDAETLWVANVVARGVGHPFPAATYNEFIGELHDCILGLNLPFPVLLHWRQMDPRIAC